jgi:hypothetical protein
MDEKVIRNPEFVHMYRAQIYPDGDADGRIEAIKSACLKHRFQNVVLMFNAEEFNVGHITKEEVRPWIDVIKKAKAEFAKAGITTSLNPWMEIGHLDRGRKLKPGQDFQTMVDRFGKSCEMVACPLDEAWQRYYLDLMAYYVREIEPSILWIEDDFRLHNHTPLNWGGCFCPHHMEAYCRKLGKQESREEFVRALEQEEPSPERKAWLEVSRETMLSLAKKIGDTVRSLGLKTSVGLMSSATQNHAMEGRHWEELHEALSPDGVIIDRIHLPAYRDFGGRNFAADFEMISMANRALLGDKALIYPEFENGTFNHYVKDTRFASFELETALALGIDGCTYSISEFTGNGPSLELGYFDAISALNPYLDAIKKLHFLPSQLRGIVVPIDEDTVLHRHAQGFLSLVPDENAMAGYLASLGFSCRYSKGKSFHDEIVALKGQNAWNFSDDELKALFKDNFVYLDGVAAYILCSRGLGSLVGIRSIAYAGNRKDTNVLEMVPELHGTPHYKVSAQEDAGEFYDIKYEPGVRILSHLYGCTMEETGNGVAVGPHFYLNPYKFCAQRDAAQYDELRRVLTGEALLEHASKPLVYTDEIGVYAHLYEQEGRHVLFLTNANYVRYGSISFRAKGFEFSAIESIRHGGTAHAVGFAKEGDLVKVDEPLDYLSTATLILQH